MTVAQHNYDAAIVGAGPAGSWCAHQMARAGARVVVIDGSHPREKPCGGGVTARALSLVGEQSGHQATTIKSASFGYGGRRADIDLAAHHRGSRLDVVSRLEFDGRLLARARTAGASVIAERVTALDRAAGRWQLRTRTCTIAARWLVGADGANSLVRRRVSRPFARADLSIACGYFIPGVCSTRIDIEFVAQPAGYIWAFPRPDHVAVGIGAQADEASTPALMAIVDEWLRVHMPDAAGRRERYSWPIPSLTAASLQHETPVGDGWLLLGDAAGLVDPITREGIFFALQSAEFAAASLTANSETARAYAERLRDEIYPELLGAARLKARFFRPAFVNLLIHALHRSGRIRDVMADLVAGEQPYASLRARLLGTWELGLLWDLLRLQRT
jgi:geranylgeranyl reductase family protein